ncbi:exosortase/archaeosortase family protein [Kitasatospora sp. NPDC056783]|uniref:exosortase/archaeosortase family protein n=1 Tax=Kitasatospora sp. NPDC056783 TaxID=3345943 RepID=UPI0036C85C7D
MTADAHPQPARPPGAARRPPSRHGRTPLSGRVLAAVAGPLLLGLCGFLVVGERAYRFREMAAARWLVSHGLGLRTLLLESPDAPVLYAGDAGGFGRGIALSTGCGSALLIAPLALLAGVLLLFGTRRPTRVLLGFVLAAGLVVAANLGRLTLIVAMQHRYGDEGFGWTHVLFGSLLMMAAGLIALLLFLFLTTRTSTRDTEAGAP